MSKYTEIFDYMRTCPQLARLWSIGATEDIGVRVIFPSGASPAVQYQEKFNIYGNYECVVEPYPSVYEDYQINCYNYFDAQDSSAPADNINILSIDDVQAVCDWVAEQNANDNLPKITGKNVVSIECNPFMPQIRGINREKSIIAYFITVRIRYVNTTQRKTKEYVCAD